MTSTYVHKHPKGHSLVKEWAYSLRPGKRLHIKVYRGPTGLHLTKVYLTYKGKSTMVYNEAELLVMANVMQLINADIALYKSLLYAEHKHKAEVEEEQRIQTEEAAVEALKKQFRKLDIKAKF